MSEREPGSPTLVLRDPGGGETPAGVVELGPGDTAHWKLRLQDRAWAKAALPPHCHVNLHTD